MMIFGLQRLSYNSACRVVLGIAIVGRVCTTVGQSFMFVPFKMYLEKDVLDYHLKNEGKYVDDQFLSMAWMVALLLAAAWVPFTGQLVDRYGPRPVLVISGTLQGLGLVLMGLAGTGEAGLGPVFVALAYILIRVAATETGDFCFSYSVNMWWVERRGVGMGILASIGALEFVLPAVTTAIILATNWRATAIGLGAVTGGFVVLGGLCLSKPPKQPLSENTVALAKASPVDSGPEFTLKQALRTPMLHCLFLCRLLVGLAWAGINLQMDTILQDSGHPKTDIIYVNLSMTWPRR